ncbi:hypothetical protein Forpi1262_v014589 [Fusarium oxysporum f. sp. raphani]|uniref:Chromo domain-containing protein n=1 Tax=Fusarium oxysporum f. sp. raphani TaxID=96318 RepID=A0A8J5PI90_FUSOX|nr:hypothetical protein Forpi1262_v014589 [Fusarium oxysporum f. sp. raphani]
MVPVPLVNEICGQGDKVPPYSNKDATNDVNWESEKHTVDCLIGHKLHVETSTVEFYVKWANGITTKEPEWILQQDIPTLVFKYWERLGGRREATGFTSDHVFKILDVIDAIGQKKKYLVQWVGYPASEKELTWEEESKLHEVAQVELESFHRIGAALDSTNIS